MILFEIFSIIIIHWIADFVMQDEKWALGKSKNWKDLLSHTVTYTVCFLLLSFWFLITYMTFTGTKEMKFDPNILWFFPITFVAHTITDYFTSKIVSKKFAKSHYGSAIPNFGAFTIIGIDQVLHYVQLFTTYAILKNGTY